MKTKILTGETYDVLIFFCPGCGLEHPYTINSKTRPNWNWNGDLEKPTLTPSLLCNPSYPEHRCHLSLTDGIINYYDDCFHKLKNQQIPLVELSDDWIDSSTVPSTN